MSAAMIRALMSIKPWVLLTSGHRLSVQLMNSARRSSNRPDRSVMVGDPAGLQRIGQRPHREAEKRHIFDQKLPGRRQHGETARGHFADSGSGEQEAGSRHK